jgi:hypothetical protein
MNLQKAEREPDPPHRSYRHPSVNRRNNRVRSSCDDSRHVVAQRLRATASTADVLLARWGAISSR